MKNKFKKVVEFTKEYKWQLLVAGIGLGIMAVGLNELDKTADKYRTKDSKRRKETGFDNSNDASLIDELVNHWEGEPYTWNAGITDGNDWLIVSKDPDYIHNLYYNKD